MKERIENTERLLLIQLKRAGDVLVTTPVISALRRRFPNAQIDFLTDQPFAVLLEGYPDLNDILIYDRTDPIGLWKRVRAQRYDWVFDFQSSPRSALVALASGAPSRAGYAVPFWGGVFNRHVRRPRGSQSVVEGKFSLLEAVFGPLGARPERRIYLRPEEIAWAREAMPASPAGQAVVGVIPTHRRESRRWKMAHFAQAARRLKEEGHAVWFFWGPGEESEVRALAAQVPGALVIPPTNFRQMAALLNRCRVVLTNDNGPMHLAVCVGASTVTLYGPTDPLCWNPGGSNHRALQAKDVPCLGCNLNDCPFGHECMEHVPADLAVSACREQLQIAAGALR